MTAARYLDKCSPPFRQRAHRALADYFDGRWVDGKVWVPKVTSRTVKDLSPRLENRMVGALLSLYSTAVQKPLALGPGVGLDPKRHTFASPNTKYINMLVYFGVT